MSGAESIAAEEWLYQTLSGDATLAGLVSGVYAYQIPQDASLPAVLYSYNRGQDVQGVGTARVMASLVYQVKAVVQGESLAPALPIARRIDALLQGAVNITVADGQVLACVRESIVSYAETDEGLAFRHLGGLYRIYAQ